MPWREPLRRVPGSRIAWLIATLLVVMSGVLLMRERNVHQLRVRAPVPSDTPLAVSMNELAPSVFSVPVQVALQPLIQVVEGALPRAFGSLEDRQSIDGRDDLEAAFQVDRGPIGASEVIRSDNCRVGAQPARGERTHLGPVVGSR